MQVYPYVRTAVNNDSLAYFAYNGDTNGANWPKNQWLLLKATVTTQANENGIYMSSYTGTSLNDKVYYFVTEEYQKKFSKKRQEAALDEMVRISQEMGLYDDEFESIHKYNEETRDVKFRQLNK
jgi:YHS domain-containing protein